MPAENLVLQHRLQFLHVPLLVLDLPIIHLPSLCRNGSVSQWGQTQDVTSYHTPSVPLSEWKCQSVGTNTGRNFLAYTFRPSVGEWTRTLSVSGHEHLRSHCRKNGMEGSTNQIQIHIQTSVSVSTYVIDTNTFRPSVRKRDRRSITIQIQIQT